MAFLDKEGKHKQIAVIPWNEGQKVTIYNMPGIGRDA